MALFTQVPFALRDNGLAVDAALDRLPARCSLVSILLMLPFLRDTSTGRGAASRCSTAR